MVEAGGHVATGSGGDGTVPGMQQMRAAPATLEAVLERITYANQETGYTVARVATDRSADLLTVVGPLLGAQPGAMTARPYGSLWRSSDAARPGRCLCRSTSAGR
jgi:hypothetical protein